MKIRIHPAKTGQFWIGAGMTLVGLLIFFSHIYVSSNRISWGITIGSLHLNTGIVLVPFIIGIILVFLLPKKKWPRVIVGIGILLMIIAAMLSVNIRVRRMAITLWLAILVLVFGGIVLVLRALKIGKS